MRCEPVPWVPDSKARKAVASQQARLTSRLRKASAGAQSQRAGRRSFSEGGRDDSALLLLPPLRIEPHFQPVEFGQEVGHLAVLPS